MDELNNTVLTALGTLPTSHKASFLLNTALSLIDAGKYGEDVEKYLEVYLKTPGLGKEDMKRVLIERGKARKNGGERLLEKAKQDFHAVLKLDPQNREIHSLLAPRIHFAHEPAYTRCPPEIWTRIAEFTPRYHLRTWLFLSTFHRSIASRLIFHTLDLYFGSDDQENLNRGLDIFDRAKADPQFANRVKVLRLHWAYEEGDMLDLMLRIFRTALPEFRALKEFEWIGYPELRAEMVQAILPTHAKIRGLGLIGWHFDAVGVSAFTSLTKYTLRAEDDDGFADMSEIRSVLDQNQSTLTHLILGAYLQRNHSWDHAFQSPTIANLTQLDLVDTRISQLVFSRIAHANRLRSLTLHGTFEEPSSATVIFSSDHVLASTGKHTFLPDLESFRFVLVGHDDDLALYTSVTSFLRGREKLRRLDLGSCPWDLVSPLLPTLPALRVLGVRISSLTVAAIELLVQSLQICTTALNLSTVVSSAPIHTFAAHFANFRSLSFLHLHCWSKRRPKPNLMSDKDFRVQTDLWLSNARSIACTLSSLDFLGWNGEHYVIVRSTSESLESDCSVEIKELPSRRRLDCGKGVDLGGEDVAWLERKDVPMDYEEAGLE